LRKLVFVFHGISVDVVRDLFNVLKRERHGSYRRDGGQGGLPATNEP
jgi:hypothetical protein